MRPWYKYSERTDDAPRARLITPFSKVWGFGAPVTLALIIINAAIWLIMVITSSAGWLDLFDWWYDLFAMTPDYVYHGRVHQILTSIFLHSGQDFLHLFFNMYLLWVFGPRVERTFSSKTYLAFYIVCGIAGSLLSLCFRTIMGDTDIPSLGASSSVFGMVVAYGFLFANETLLLFFVIPVKAWKAVVGFIIAETLFVLFGLMQSVDHWAHLGGAGAAAIWMLILLRRVGSRTSHGWRHTSQPLTFMGRDRRTSKVRRPGKGFRVIFTRPGQTFDEHPEGTDDEPPPDWFEV